MKRTTLMLPDDLAGLLDQERRRLDVSAAEVVRRALTKYFGARAAPGPPAFIGLGRSGYRTTARDFDELLAREWTYEQLMGQEPANPSTEPPAEPETDAAGDDASATMAGAWREVAN